MKGTKTLITLVLLGLICYSPLFIKNNFTEEKGQESIVIIAEEALTTDQLIDKYAEIYGQDAILARKIMKAESELYQSAINHNRRADGTIWSTDYCMWQINDYYWDSTAQDMGWNYKTNEEDCIEMGFYIMSINGTSPWGASQHNWSR